MKREIQHQSSLRHPFIIGLTEVGAVFLRSLKCMHELPRHTHGSRASRRAHCVIGLKQGGQALHQTSHSVQHSSQVLQHQCTDEWPTPWTLVTSVCSTPLSAA